MPLYNGNYVKRCPRGYRKDKKTDQCILIRKPTNYSVNTGIWNLIDPNEPIDPIDPIDPPIPPIIPIVPVKPVIPDIPIIPIIPPYVPPYVPPEPVVVKSKEKDSDLDKILLGTGGGLVGLAMTIAIGRNPSSVSSVMNETVRILRGVEESSYEAADITESIELTSLLSDQLTSTSPTTGIRFRGLGQPFTRTINQTTLRQVVTTSRGSNVTQTSQMLDDGMLGDGLSSARDQLDSIKMNTPDTFPDTFGGAADADDVVMLDENSPLIEMSDMLSSAQRAARRVQDTTGAQGMGDIELKQTTTRRFLDSLDDVIGFGNKALSNSKKVMSESAARGLNWYSREVKKLPENVYNNLRQAEATERQISNFVDSVKIEGNYGDKAYIEEFTNQAYKVFQYDIEKGTINLPAKFKGDNAVAEFNNVENLRVTELRASQKKFGVDVIDEFPMADAGNQFSAAAQADTDALLGNSTSLRVMKRRYTEQLKNGDLINYIVEDGSDTVTVQEGSLKNKQISREEFEERAQKVIDEGDGWFDMEETDGGLYGGDEKSLKELDGEYKASLEEAADKINGFEAPKRKVTVDELDTWAKERTTFEDELTQDLLNRKSKFGQTVESAAEELQVSIDNAMKVITKTLNRTMDFITGETTPIYNESLELIANVEEYNSFGGDVALESEFLEELFEEKGLATEDAIFDVGLDAGLSSAAVDVGLTSAATVVTGTGIARWISAAGRASNLAAAGEEGLMGAYAIAGAAAMDMALMAAGGAVIMLATFVGVSAYFAIKDLINGGHHDTPEPALDQFMEALGIISEGDTNDTSRGYGMFEYKGQTYFSDQLPMVFRMAMVDNKAIRNIILEVLQDRYKNSDLYDPEYPVVMDFLRETRPIVQREFTTLLRKSISGEKPLSFILQFRYGETRNHYLEQVLLNDPKYKNGIGPKIIEKKEKLYNRLREQRLYNKKLKYLEREDRIDEIQSNKKDRTRLKNITKSIVDDRYSTGVFVSKHSGDVHRLNEGIHYLDTHEYGHFGFKFVYDDALENVMENFNRQQIEFGKKRAAEQYANLSDRDKAIVGQTQEQHRADVIAAQQIADPNLSQRDNAILGGASGAAAASTPRGYEPPPQNVQPKANTTPVQNMYSMDDK